MIIINIFTVIVSFAFMEFIAWATHKFVMHGFLWTLHKDHHTKESSGFFEKNDFFFLIFAIPGMLLIYFGLNNGFDIMFFSGIGITLYGLAYFLVHEIFIHQRFKFLKKSESGYLNAVRRAHKIHHKHLQKENGECFGMLWVTSKFYKNTSQS
ncbi:MAG TPA: sterol desaturase family protein [Ignavibacteria bacterium]|nr:sterol desaturase family protein [Ignavibacteria bacterium]HRA99358.1 sterol desaturase family protein [Ignavibacteria bacterium]